MPKKVKCLRATPAPVASKSRQELCSKSSGRAYDGTTPPRLIAERASFAHDVRQKLQSLILLEGMLADIVEDGRAKKLISQLEAATASLSNWTSAYSADRNPVFRDPPPMSSPEQTCEAQRQEQENSTPVLDAPHRQELVFIVDDDRAVRDAISVVLSAHGYLTEEFAGGFAFIKAHSIERSGCLLVDACMPYMDGFQLMERLKGCPDVAGAIMMTGQGDIKMAVRAMKAGVLDFLEKPFSQDELLTSIERAFKPALDEGVLLQRRLTARDRIAQLSRRERQILDRVLSGQPSKNIAGDLCISQRTVDSHRAAIMRKTGTRSLPALLRIAVTATCD
jgi:FixJ family two-component response regulator